MGRSEEQEEAPTPRRLQRRVRMNATIRAATEQLGMDADEFCDYLQCWTGKRRVRDLSSHELRRVLQRLQALGERPREKPVRFDADEPLHVRIAKGTWLELHRAGAVQDPSMRALNAFVRRMVRVDHLHWLTDSAKAGRVLQALQAWLGHVRDQSDDARKHLGLRRTGRKSQC